VIPFIKVWVLLPCAILLTFIFTRLSNAYSQERVFYIMISGFLAFFAFFAFVLYPLRHSLHADTLANILQTYVPIGFKGMVAMMRHWSFTLFYVMAELWGSIVMTVLFWGFANQVTRITEARRFFGVYCFGANCCAILAGQMAKLLPHEEVDASVIKEDWALPLMILVTVVIACGVTVMGIFRWMNKNVLNDPSFDEFHSSKKALKAKGKLSVKESFSYLANSKYLLCIATIVLSYNLVINLVEVVWKDQLRRLYPSPGDYFDFMGELTSMIGVFSAITSLLMAHIIARLGWTGTALVTPVMMLVTCAGFFGFLFCQNYIGEGAMMFLGTSPLAIAVMFGAAQNCLSKAMKYSVFDATKEMAFVPLSQECKLKGKAAIDGVGSRMGKSGGSLIHTCLLMLCGSLTASAPFVAVILMSVIGFWIYATKSLGKQFNELVTEEPPMTEASAPEVQVVESSMPATATVTPIATTG
jgi:AAA family ATP:ADP antiporter